MLRPSRPMMRPFISSFGRLTTVIVASLVWSAGDALHDGGQDAARALVALLGGVALDLAHAMLRLGLRLVLDLADQASGAPRPRSARRRARARPAGAAAARPAGRRSTSSSARAFRASRLRSLERRRLAIERLLPVQESALGALERGALLARLFLGGATQVQGLVLPLEDDLLLLGARLGHEALGVAPRRA